MTTTMAKPQVPVAPTVRTRRRPLMVVLGIVLIIVSALAAMLVYSSAGKTVKVVAVSEHLQRGQTISVRDLTTAELPAGASPLSYISANDLDSLIGQQAAVEMLPGSLLVTGSAVQQLQPKSGYSIVGLSLNTAQMPDTAFHAGDAVRVVETTGSNSTDEEAAPTVVNGHVVSVTTTDAGTTIINVEVANTDAPTLADRAAAGRVALILDPAG